LELFTMAIAGAVTTPPLRDVSLDDKFEL